MKKTIYSLAFLLTINSLSSNNVSAQIGSLDLTFNSTGKVSTDFNTSNEEIHSLAIQADGKIVAGGYSYAGINYEFALARYNSDGTLDATFGTNGKVITALGLGDEINSIAIQTDGKILAAGYAYNASNSDFGIARYNTDGSLDNTFGTAGIVNGAIGMSHDGINSIVLQSDGKIIAGGFSSDGTNYKFALVRYNSNGTLDATFGTGGIVISSVGSSFEAINSIVLQPNGKIITGGYSYTGSSEDFTLVRYNSDGTMDATFGTAGIVVTSTAAGNFDEEISSLILQVDGKIIAGGPSNDGIVYPFTLVRYNSDGSLDTSFGTNGIVYTLSGGDADVANSLALQSDGSILAGGYIYGGGASTFGLARYTTNGTLDLTFGTAGIISTSIGGTADGIQSVLIQSDSKILAGGISYNGTNNDFAIARYNGGALGLTENESQFPQVSIFPNPNNGKFELQIADNYEIENASIEILNTVGESIYQTTLQKHNYSTIDLTNEANGIYFVSIKINDNQLTQKIIKH